ncbi:flavin-containing monooxygenase [Rhodococcoides yunnanense]|uniref:flavin-containing monooxygenase n=1 Tax=Rhodococcoides yunnanense TaxID=278209 RepID=UPI000934BCC3|nr:NAD(P)/FAD-dependent oxidoreductase [Rhodococcus yunnanensis]
MTRPTETPEYDVVVIGAGFSGLYATYRLAQAGYSVHAFEAADGVGGVWTWNNYPGARTDSLHETYQFSFDRDFASSWRYSDIHPTQPEVLDYLNTFADHFSLRDLYSFDTRVEQAAFDADAGRWNFTTDTGETARAKYFVTGLGLVSAPLFLNTPGFEKFTGRVVHTSRWPAEGIDFVGKKVAVIGTGSSGVQVAPAIVDDVAELTVFQRTPNWCPPTGHRPVSDDEHVSIVEDFDGLWSRVRQHPAGWPWNPTGRNVLDADPDERERIFEECWTRGGFSMLFETFDDVNVVKEANDLLCDFAARKVRAIVQDPAVAESLIPDHPYGAKRPPASDGYLEMFNRENVRLVDVRRTPIARYSESGIDTTEESFDFDIVVLATGFDAVTGAFTRMDIRGLGDESLADRWNAEGPKTFLGLGVHGFPNMLMVAGPQSPFSNLPPGAQAAGEWITNALKHFESEGIEAFHPAQEAQEAWNDHVQEIALGGLTAYGKDANSWAVGANIEGKPRVYNVYYAGFKAYADRCDEEAAAGYTNFVRARTAERVG